MKSNRACSSEEVVQSLLLLPVPRVLPALGGGHRIRVCVILLLDQCAILCCGVAPYLQILLSPVRKKNVQHTGSLSESLDSSLGGQCRVILRRNCLDFNCGDTVGWFHIPISQITPRDFRIITHDKPWTKSAIFVGFAPKQHYIFNGRCCIVIEEF